MEERLKNVHAEIDLVTTPMGDPLAMVHCNNCTSDINAWVNLFREFAEEFGLEVDMTHLYSALATLKIGLDILRQEHVKVDKMYAHGGYFTTKGVGRKIMAAAMKTARH